eukprot:GHVP01029761.1.p1 GENE.GHVP01029761.1~~GHVP01029761.1.p1  ORF type:complete len:274 (+),score=44.10 GHVP01029761.1:116-937(+)
MEFKTLFDQLNTACEDYCGIPQANGFPVSDDLYQANSDEPEFRGFRSESKPYIGFYENIPGREDIVRFAYFLRQVLVEASENYEGRSLADVTPSSCRSIQIGKENVKLESLLLPGEANAKKFEFNKSYLESVFRMEPEDQETEFYSEEPEDKDGRRLWRFRLCNCSNKSMWRTSDPVDPKEIKCKGADCHRFQITWKQEAGISQEDQRKAARKLWLFFEITPRRFDVCIELQMQFLSYDTSLNQEFNEAWETIQKSKVPCEASSERTPSESYF